LEKLALSQYKALFAEQEVDLATFLMLSEADLRELGVQTFGARRKMVLGTMHKKVKTGR
jgi:protein bicaudal C